MSAPPKEGPREPAPREFHADWRNVSHGLAAVQDYSNLERIQQGIKQRSHPGNLLAQVQEIRIAHFHAILDQFLSDSDISWESISP